MGGLWFRGVANVGMARYQRTERHANHSSRLRSSKEPVAQKEQTQQRIAERTKRHHNTFEHPSPFK